MPASLSQTLRARLAEAAEPARATGMQAYMKSAMPYLGVAAVPLRKVCQEVFAGLAWPDSATWQADSIAIWRGAQFREERYAAIELTGVKAARPFQRRDALGLYEEMIVTGAWWDYVDVIAAHRLGPMLQSEGEPFKQTMRAWSTGDDMWKRRSAILCQIRAKDRTDLDLLYTCIEPSLGSKQFFLRKAIGWALREVAWFNPDEVKRYVARHIDQLSPLSRREALKNTGGAA